METGNYWGMHMMWWIFWVAILVFIFFTPWGSKKNIQGKFVTHPKKNVC